MRLVIIFDMLLNPSFKMTTGLASIAGTTANTSKFISYIQYFYILYSYILCTYIL